MKLLLAMDLSQHSQQVLNEVARRPWPRGTTACVLHVIDWPPWATDPSMIESGNQAAVNMVESAAAKLNSIGLPTIAKVLESRPRIAIADYAKQWGANLIVIGSQGTSAVARLLMGSVAQATLRRAVCSVEILRPHEHSAQTDKPMKVLIGVDGSDCSLLAVTSVATRPWPAESTFRVISAVPCVVLTGEMVAPMFTPIPTSEYLVDQLQEKERAQAKEAVDRAKQILCEAHLLKVVEDDPLPLGDPREVLVTQAKLWGADLIVVGSHGYHAIDRLMLGSVSESVAMNAPCSVEVVR